ncbi:cellulose synthase-like protein H1 [Punica granatum]|uniref:Cellulose synthase-like protein H1 n=1 Tax=Punica granatum TaxID=22663 RepID=A0A6P8CGR6_PUNGR|nr:cellulose synthase-like protein H1 [Punica granatum]
MGDFNSSSMEDDDMAAPLFERQLRKNYVQRAVDITILLLMVSLLSYRLVCIRSHSGDGWEVKTWQVAMGCEAWFTFVWVLVVSTKWNLLRYLTFPKRLLQRTRELPALDMFVTTADPELEPPIIMVNTVLSLMAVDYPGAAHKLAVYVSDDACSPLTFFALSKAAKFAQLWVPFCRKYNIEVRAPFQYFSPAAEQPPSAGGGSNSPEFQQEWKHIKNEYESLNRKVEDAHKKPVSSILSAGEFAAFANTELGNHPPIVKIIWENKETAPDGLPHLIYISREKRPKHHHHYKAGAMNALIRVSGVMTNAPFMLNVDCDMYAHNPHIALHALCLLLDPRSQNDTAYVQCPQKFYDGLKDDPFGNQLVVLQEILGQGIVSIQGPFYGGTGCFHRRRVIYGALPKNVDSKKKNARSMDEISLSDFGSSEQFLKLVTRALKDESGAEKDLPSSLEAALHVASCGYEYGTSWGKKIGLIYGSTTEDISTGMTIQSKGWRSAYCSPDPPAFLGCAPTGGPASLNQMKRWSTGLLEILVSKSNPMRATLLGRLQFRQCLTYIWLLIWGIRSIPELIYALLPAYCIITNSHFLPKVHEPAILIPASVFAIYNIYTLLEHFRCGLSARAWWNYQQTARIKSACAWLFGVLSILLKVLGISDTVFEITKKEQSTANGQPDADMGRFTFDESPIFMPGTTVLLVQLAALAMLMLGIQPAAGGANGSGLAEVACSLLAVLYFWPFLRGLLGKDKYGIPLKTIYKSAALSTVFVLFCRFSSVGLHQ